MLNRGDNIIVDIDILLADGYSPDAISEITGIDVKYIEQISGR